MKKERRLFIMFLILGVFILNINFTLATFRCDDPSCACGMAVNLWGPSCKTNSDCPSGSYCLYNACAKGKCGNQRCYGCGGGDDNSCTVTSWGSCSVSCGGGTQTSNCGTTRSCNTQACCTPVNAVCESFSAIDCGVTETREGSCGGSSCTVIGTKCSTGKECIANHCVSINQTYWANLLGSPIDVAEKRDTLAMLVGGEFLSGKTISYTIQQKEGTEWWNPFSWFASWDSLDKLNGLGLQYYVPENISLYKFIAKVQDSSVNQASNQIDIQNTNNAMPIANIISPVNNYLAIVNEPITFTHNSSDIDDLLNISWNFGDNSKVSFRDYSLAFTTSRGNVDHNYTNYGIYEVELKAKEMTREQFDTDHVTIKVLKEGINIFPIITSPRLGIINENFVKFNASQSHILNCTKSSCPNGKNCTVIVDSVVVSHSNDLYCFYVHAPNTKNYTDYSLLVNWTVFPSTGNNIIFSKQADWQSNYSNIVEFSYFFDNNDRYKAKLTLKYD